MAGVARRVVGRACDNVSDRDEASCWLLHLADHAQALAALEAALQEEAPALATRIASLKLAAPQRARARWVTR